MFLKAILVPFLYVLHVMHALAPVGYRRAPESLAVCELVFCGST
jgi:hypothetical protein